MYLNQIMINLFELGNMGQRHKILSSSKYIKSSNQINFYFSLRNQFSIQLLVHNYNKYFKMFLISEKGSLAYFFGKNEDPMACLPLSQEYSFSLGKCCLDQYDHDTKEIWTRKSLSEQ